MSFLDSIKRQEEEKHRISAWSRAVTQLSRLIRQYLRQAEAESPLIVRADLIRVAKILFVRLTLLLNGRTVTMTPLSFADPRTPERGGCVEVRSTNGMIYNFLWNGNSPAISDDWKIVPIHDTFGGGYLNGPEPLSERSLDEAFNRLFGLASRTEPPADKAEDPANLTRSIGALPLTIANGAYSGINTNGKMSGIPDTRENKSFGPAFRKN